MEIKCTKCRYKFEALVYEGMRELTVVCPRCGEAQTVEIPAPAPISFVEEAQPVEPETSAVQETPAAQETPVAPETPAEPSVAVVPPVAAPDDIPEEHLKYVPRAGEEQPSDDGAASQTAAAAPQEEPEPLPAKEEPVEQPKEEPAAPQRKPGGPLPAPKKSNSCGKMFLTGCLVVAVLAIIAIAILSFAGKSFFNSISSGDEDEKEQVDRSDRNITIQPENNTEAGTNAAGQQTTEGNSPAAATQQEPVTDTGGEGNDNTAVQEPTKPTEEEKQKSEKDVATAGGTYNCRGTMGDSNVDLKLNVTSGGFVTGKLTDNSTGKTLDITGDRYGEEYFLTASNSTDLINITLKKQGRTLKGTAKKELQNMNISVSY